ncbi:DUF7064 domain-containing protein [Actinomadura sp. 3N407]|uniref:DUF7064 domain-containing protein n=1 Tax=Actinomadura sp. 3N407 TaxID=3457423 RepID=UPI003FCD3EF2
MAKIIEHGTWNLRPADEDLHDPGPEPLWNESYYFDFAAPDGSVAGYMRLGLYPNWDRAWYWAALVRPGRPAHFPRALCRFDIEDGRTGHGWTEWHQPPDWQDHGWSHLAEESP